MWIVRGRARLNNMHVPKPITYLSGVLPIYEFWGSDTKIGTLAGHEHTVKVICSAMTWNSYCTSSRRAHSSQPRRISLPPICPKRKKNSHGYCFWPQGNAGVRCRPLVQNGILWRSQSLSFAHRVPLVGRWKSSPADVFPYNQAVWLWNPNTWPDQDGRSTVRCTGKP